MPRDAPVPVTWRQVHAFRMARHHLDHPLPRAQIARAVRDAGGVQAQVMAAAQLAVRVRVRGATIEDVHRALWRDRTLARVWCLRGALHIVPADELEMHVRGCASRQESRVSAYLARKGVPKDSFERVVEAATVAMDRPRTRGEIARRVSEALGMPIVHEGSRGWGSPRDVAGFRLGRSVLTVTDLAWTAGWRGLVCFGPDEGHGSTFVRPNAWLREWREMAVEDAEDALLQRHLRTFGPATVADFAMWTSLTMRRSRETWSRLEDTLQQVSVGGSARWVLRDDMKDLTRAKLARTTVRLLPYFDSYLMGHKDRGHLVDAAHHRRVYRLSGWVYPAVLVDGRVAGEWSYERKGRRLEVAVQPYASLTAEAKDLVRGEAEDVARFLDAPEARVKFAKAR